MRCFSCIIILLSISYYCLSNKCPILGICLTGLFSIQKQQKLKGNFLFNENGLKTKDLASESEVNNATNLGHNIEETIKSVNCLVYIILFVKVTLMTMDHKII